MNFSVAIIMKNEEKTLPRLAASLKEFQQRGGVCLALDTGSTDDTMRVATDLGFIVYGVGDKYLTVLDEKLCKEINEHIDESEEPVVKPGDKLFNYSAARNFIASKSKTDMVAMPDADECYTKFDIDKICKAIDDGADQLEYNFVFSHDEFGNEAVKFSHCKFYNRKKLEWTGVIHEVLKGSAKRVFLGEDVIKLEHFQNQGTNRDGYLRGLALDCHLNPENDRNSHYYGRELLWKGRPKSAIKELKRHLTLGNWKPEKSQSMVFIGDAYRMMGDEENALKWWHKAYDEESGRREPLAKLIEFYFHRGDARRVAAYGEAMLTIPWNTFYANTQSYYTYWPHELLYWAYWQLGDRQKSKEHYDKALELCPTHSKYLADYRFFYSDYVEPSVTIVIPTLGRTEKLARLLELIEKNAHYENYDVVVIHDGEELQDRSFYGKAKAYKNSTRQGVPKTLKRGVSLAKGDLIMFLGNDCVPREGFLKEAVHAMFREWGLAFDGLVGLNDEYWENGEIATHWLASKKLLDYLEGEFFHTGYQHVGCDNELTERCRMINKYVWAKDAKVYHDHPVREGMRDLDEVYQLAWEGKDKDRALLEKRAKQYGFKVT